VCKFSCRCLTDTDDDDDDSEAGKVLVNPFLQWEGSHSMQVLYTMLS